MSTEERKLAAIVFTDICGFTELMGRDETKAMSLLDQQRALLKPIISNFNGEWLKEIGDGVLISFPSAVKAVTCSLEIQRILAHNSDLTLRIGIHIGDVIKKGGDVFGDGVNIASRLEPLAEPGGICVSERVHEDIKNKPEISTAFQEEQLLKGVDKPIKVYSIFTQMGTAPSIEEPKPQTKDSKSKLPILAAGLAIGLLVTVLAVRSSVPSSTTSDGNSLAVFNFENLSAENDNDRTGQILQELVITDLSGIKNLKIYSSQRLFDIQKQLGAKETRYIEPSLALDIAREVGAASMMTGNIIKVGNTIVLTSRLLDVDDGSVIQSRKVEGADIYGMVDQLSSFVIEDLNLGVIETVDLAVSKKTSSNVTAYSHYVTGNDYLNYGKFIEAVVELQEAVKMDPTFKKAMYKLAIAQWWSKGAEVASSDSATISTLDTYLSLPDLDKDEIKLAEGVKNIVSNKFIDALESFEYLTEIYPDNKEYWYLLGESHFHGTLKDYKALNAFEKAMNLDPEFDLASFHIIHLYTKEEKFDKAVEMLEKKLKTNPDSPSLLNNLGTVRYSQGELAEAINIADKVLSVDPNNWNSAWGKALGLIGLGEFEKADASISHLNRLSPNLWPVFVMESGLYFSHGKFIERRELLINKYKFEKDVPAKIGLAIGVLFTDCLAKDKKRLEKDVELFSGIGDTEKSRYWEFVYWMSFAHSLLDNPGLAINYQKILMGLETSEARKPWQNAYIIDSNVDIAMREGDWKGVITKFRDYDGSGAHNAIMSLSRYKKCEAEFNLNKYDISLMTAKKMSSPNQHFVGFVFCQSFGFYWQGRIYEEKGETQEAISAYESLMELWKDGDERLPKRKDAIKRLANLKKTS